MPFQCRLPKISDQNSTGIQVEGLWVILLSLQLFHGLFATGISGFGFRNYWILLPVLCRFFCAQNSPSIYSFLDARNLLVLLLYMLCCPGLELRFAPDLEASFASVLLVASAGLDASVD